MSLNRMNVDYALSGTFDCQILIIFIFPIMFVVEQTFHLYYNSNDLNSLQVSFLFIILLIL